MPPDALLAELGWSLVDAAKSEAADRVFARLLKEYPTSPHAADARFNLAESANQAHNYAEVVRLLAPLAAAKPPAPSPAESRPDRLMPAVLYRLGRTQVELRDWPAAASTLDRLLARVPRESLSPRGPVPPAEAALELGDAAAAESGFAALLAEPARPEDPGGLPPVRPPRTDSLLGGARSAGRT